MVKVILNPRYKVVDVQKEGEDKIYMIRIHKAVKEKKQRKEA